MGTILKPKKPMLIGTHTNIQTSTKSMFENINHVSIENIRNISRKNILPMSVNNLMSQITNFVHILIFFSKNMKYNKTHSFNSKYDNYVVFDGI